MGQSMVQNPAGGAVAISTAWNPATLSVIAMDVDRTLVPNEITPLNGANLEAVVRALESGVKVVLLSGTPYEAEVSVKIYQSADSDRAANEVIHYERESVGLRCAQPIQELLLKRGRPESIANLEVVTLSGVEVATYYFDPVKQSYSVQHSRREAANFSPERQLEVGRALAASYLSVFADTVLKDSGHFAVTLDELAQAQGFAAVRKIFESAISPHSKARFWVFDSEMVILDHENQLDAPRTEIAVADAVTRLQNIGKPLSAEEGYYPRSGDAFIKVTRCEKGLALADFVSKHGINGLVVGLGDSLTDDFLWRSLNTPYLPIYLGPGRQVENHPGIMVARHWGQDNLKERFTDRIINRLLDAYLGGAGGFDSVISAQRAFRIENPMDTESRLASFQGFIFDVDGVLISGETALPGARETLAELQRQKRPFVLLTNNSTRSRQDVLRIMERFELPIDVDNIITAPYAAGQYLLREAATAQVLVLGADGLREELRQAGIFLTEDPEEADYLVTGADPGFCVAHLKRGLAALREGARWLAVSLDKLHPTPEGYHSGGGAMAGALQAYVDRDPDVYVGKPSTEIMDAALGRLGLERHKVVMVGDTLTSDIAAGIASNVPSCLVFSGATTPEKLAVSSIHPDLVISGISEIGQAMGLQKLPHTAPPRKPGAKAVVSGGRRPDPARPSRVFVVGDVEFAKGLKALDVEVTESPGMADCLITAPHLELDKAGLDTCVGLLTTGAAWIAVEDDDLSATTVTGGRLLRGALSFCLERQPDLLLNSSSGIRKPSGAGESSIRIYTLGNLILESVSIGKKQEKFARHVRHVMDMLQQFPERNCVIVHHNDGDGITSGTILKTALERAGWRVNPVAVEKLYTQVLEMIFARFDIPIFFADVGGGAIPEMADLNKNQTPVVVLDHHHTDAPGDIAEAAIYNLCSEAFGISGEEHVCAAGVVWAFARVLDTVNDDLAWIAVVGAISDRQNRSFGRLIGLNRIAMQVAEQRGDIEVRWFEGSRESYTLKVFSKPMAVRDLAANLTTTGTVFFHRDGIKVAMEAMARRQISVSEQSTFRYARRLQNNLFREQCRVMDAEAIQTEHFTIIDSKGRFENMGLKMIGLFLEDITNCRIDSYDPRKYQIGFQNVRSEIKGLGRIGEGWVKVSGRLPPTLEAEVRAGRMPGFKAIFAQISEKMNLSLDACHDYAAALVLHRDQKRSFIALMEEIVTAGLDDVKPVEGPLGLRQKELEDLQQHGVDLLIIGGGITGAGAALDAAARGLRVAMVEKRDFGGGTSMTSSKMFHGGLRYLMNLDIGLVFEALRERDTAIRLAHDMIVPMPFLFPIFVGEREVWHKELIKSCKGVVDWLYRLFTRQDPPGIVEMARHKGLLSLSLHFYSALGRLGRLRYWRSKTPKTPIHRILTPEELMEREPGLKKDGLAMGSQYWDGFMAPGDARITLQVVKTARYFGASCLNYNEVVGFLRDEHGRIRGAETLDGLTGKRHAIRAKKIINATGPWGAQTTQLAGDDSLKLRLTKGVHLIFSRQRLPINNAILIEAADGRVCWAIPWDKHALVGTTDDDYRGDPAEVAVARRDVDYLLATVNAYFPTAKLQHTDVISTTVGLRPMVSPKNQAAAGSVSREHGIFAAAGGLISIAGGKFTTYRSMAKELIDKASAALKEEFDMEIPSSATERIPIKKEGQLVCLPNLPVDVMNHGLNFYGEEFAVMTAWMEEEPQLCHRVHEGLPHCWAEIRYAVEYEQAVTLDDVMRRRTMIFLKSPDQGAAVAPNVAEFIRNLLGETQQWCDSQVAVYMQTIAESRSWEKG